MQDLLSLVSLIPATLAITLGSKSVILSLHAASSSSLLDSEIHENIQSVKYLLLSANNSMYSENWIIWTLLGLDVSLYIGEICLNRPGINFVFKTDRWLVLPLILTKISYIRTLFFRFKQDCGLFKVWLRQVWLYKRISDRLMRHYVDSKFFDFSCNTN